MMAVRLSPRSPNAGVSKPQLLTAPLSADVSRWRRSENPAAVSANKPAPPRKPRYDRSPIKNAYTISSTPNIRATSRKRPIMPLSACSRPRPSGQNLPRHRRTHSNRPEQDQPEEPPRNLKKAEKAESPPTHDLQQYTGDRTRRFFFGPQKKSYLKPETRPLAETMDSPIAPPGTAQPASARHR